MARYTESVCRLCRREGMKLFLKGDRCFKDKCAIERRNYPPGQHGRRRSKLLGYGIQLREKQKVKRIYGLLESQFRLAFARRAPQGASPARTCSRSSSAAWTTWCTPLGFAASRAQARQLVRHGHVAVNGRKVSIPSFRVSKGQVVSIKEKSASTSRSRGPPPRPSPGRRRLLERFARPHTPPAENQCSSRIHLARLGGVPAARATLLDTQGRAMAGDRVERLPDTSLQWGTAGSACRLSLYRGLHGAQRRHQRRDVTRRVSAA